MICQQFLKNYYMLNEEQRQAIGHSLDNLVKDCVFKQRDCNNDTNFVATTSATYGDHDAYLKFCFLLLNVPTPRFVPSVGMFSFVFFYKFQLPMARIHFVCLLGSLTHV